MFTGWYLLFTVAEQDQHLGPLLAVERLAGSIERSRGVGEVLVELVAVDDGHQRGDVVVVVALRDVHRVVHRDVRPEVGHHDAIAGVEVLHELGQEALGRIDQVVGLHRTGQVRDEGHVDVGRRVISRSRRSAGEETDHEGEEAEKGFTHLRLLREEVEEALNSNREDYRVTLELHSTIPRSNSTKSTNWSKTLYN